MAKKTDRQEAYGLINYFLKRYKEEYGSNPPGFNRYALAFGFEALYLDYGVAGGKELIDYYFDSYTVHDAKVFVSKYGDYSLEMAADRKDAEDRQRWYEDTVKSIKEKS